MLENPSQIAICDPSYLLLPPTSLTSSVGQLRRWPVLQRIVNRFAVNLTGGDWKPNISKEEATPFRVVRGHHRSLAEKGFLVHFLGQISVFPFTDSPRFMISRSV